MVQPRPRKIQRVSCPMCGHDNLAPAQILRKDGTRLNITTCQTCAHFIYPDQKYSFLVNGIAHRWASASDLKATIEVILRDYMPAEDVANMTVEVVEEP